MLPGVLAYKTLLEENSMNFTHTEPKDIETTSFKIIEEELENRKISLNETYASIIKRVIHTTADFDYASTMTFSENALENYKKAISEGAMIVTDTNMALAGINKKAIKKLKVDAVCYMADEEVVEEAKKEGVTRASLSMRKAAKLNRPVIYVIGNAPTALIELKNHIDKGYKPAFVIAVPVGFVNVVEAKELIMQSEVPYIVNKGRKGGSNVAAAVVNALSYKLALDT